MSEPRIAIVTAILIAATVTGCHKAEQPSAQPRPVRTVAIERRAEGEIVSLTGQVRAKDQVSLAFRLDGRMIERPVHVGDVVRPGQVVARLDPLNQENSLRSAQADLMSAEAVLDEARLAFRRQQELLKHEVTSQAKFDEAEQKLRTSEAHVASNQAELRIAQDRLSYTTLFADASGAVTAVGAESGEVVRAGQMIVQLAHDGARDAVFDVSEQIILHGPARSRGGDRPHRRSEGADHRPRAGGCASSGRGDPDIPGQGRRSSIRRRRCAWDPPSPAASAWPRLRGWRYRRARSPRPTAARRCGWSIRRARRCLCAAWTCCATIRRPSSISQGLETGELVVTAGVQTLRPGPEGPSPGSRVMTRFNLSEWALRHRSFVTYFMLVIAVAGIGSYLRLGRSEDPDFTVKTMVVQAAWPGATVDDTLEQVTDRIERKLQETPNLDYLKSYTTAGQATIFVNLKDSTPPARVPDIWYQVRKKVGDIRSTLPQGIVGPGFNDEFGDTYGIVYGFTADGFTHRRAAGLSSTTSASSSCNCRTSPRSTSSGLRTSASMSSSRPSSWRGWASTAPR